MCAGNNAAKKYILHTNTSQYIIIFYEKSHGCGKADNTLNYKVIEELQELFKTNIELTKSKAFDIMWAKKIENSAPYSELRDVIILFAHKNKSKNIKAEIKKAKYPKGVGLEAVEQLKEDMNKYPELGVILEVVHDNYTCANCNLYKIVQNTEEEMNSICNQCNNQMKKWSFCSCVNKGTIKFYLRLIVAHQNINYFRHKRQ